MELWMYILCVTPILVSAITISPNGNSPEVKMVDGMMVDVQMGFSPITPRPDESLKSKHRSNRIIKVNSTKLAINERYRRLIPYMTFYYANDLISPTSEAYNTKNVEVEKAEIVEAHISQNQREPKVIHTSHRHNHIPRYQGNRLTQYNIASANPTRLYYKEVPVIYQNSPKISQNYNPYVVENQQNTFGKFVQKQIKTPSVPFISPTRKPYLDLYHNDDTPNVHYYYTEKEQTPKYKLIPYEQTPPVKIVPQQQNIDFNVPSIPAKDTVYVKQRITRPQYQYDTVNVPQLKTKRPVTISESYYEKQHPALVQPVIESGFKPIIGPIITTETPAYSEVPQETTYLNDDEKNYEEPTIENISVPILDSTEKPQFIQYVIEEPTQKPVEHSSTNTALLANLLNSLQLNKSIPKPITKENVGASIRTLLQVLNALKAIPEENHVQSPQLSTPKPFVAPQILINTSIRPIVTSTTLSPEPADQDFHEEPYLAPVNNPSQHLDDFSTGVGSTQRFPLPVTSDDEGGTPGRPGVDYPTLTTIPHTAFDCKTQRYKGFFADPETRCQVWHYCDLNGGQASFLCPNGTIFSQAALTCDWWFNVRCASTTQLYVLNESLYKYILPHSPKFPEDYSGPLVDKYLTLKFKEMEEQFKKNKNKKTASEKMGSDENDDSTEESSEKYINESEKASTEVDKAGEGEIDRADVIIESPGSSGNVERLQDE